MLLMTAASREQRGTIRRTVRTRWLMMSKRRLRDPLELRERYRNGVSLHALPLIASARRYQHGDPSKVIAFFVAYCRARPFIGRN
jgi:hypothetical protein